MSEFSLLDITTPVPPEKHNVAGDFLPGQPVMARQLSSGSSDVLEQMREFISREQESRILLGLHAIKWAQIANRITNEEKNSLKRQMVDGSLFDPVIMNKLSLGERTALEDLSDGNSRDRQRKLAAEIEKVGFSAVSVNIIERRELEMLRKLHQDLDPKPAVDANIVALPSTDAQCCVCFEPFKVSDGVKCQSLQEPHFQCKECFTHFVEMLNTQKDASPHLFRSRQGGIRCAVPDCQSPFFSRAQVCGGVTSDAVMETYLDNLQHLKGLELYADYQLQLLQAMDDIRHTNARINEKVGTTAEAAAEAETKRIAAEREMKRLELESFAQTLRNEMPDARQCGKCGFGPVSKRGCDDLKRHDKEVVSSASGGDKKAGQYDNTCKSCGWFGVSWEKDWKPWDGKLPVCLRGDIEVSAKLLSTKCANGHEGEWREDSVTQQYCSLEDDTEGMVCRHGSEIIQSSHWSCCGSTLAPPDGTGRRFERNADDDDNDDYGNLFGEDDDAGSEDDDEVAEDQSAACQGGHRGEWRDAGRLHQHCSLAGSREGMVCTHSGGLVFSSHWSCCGSTVEESIIMSFIAGRTQPPAAPSRSSQRGPSAHVGSLSGCGGNPAGVACCAGSGCCSPSCRNCGAGTHWNCCGLGQMSSQCPPGLSREQAVRNYDAFRAPSRADRTCLEIFGGSIPSTSMIVSSSPGIWSCGSCTLFNAESRSVCEACLTARGDAPVMQEGGSVWHCLACTFENTVLTSQLCDMCGTKRS